VFKSKIYKPYTSDFISDRVKKIHDKIKDIEVELFYDNEKKVIAYIWYAITNFNGNFIENNIKGIPFRKGNILNF